MGSLLGRCVCRGASLFVYNNGGSFQVSSSSTRQLSFLSSPRLLRRGRPGALSLYSNLRPTATTAPVGAGAGAGARAKVEGIENGPKKFNGGGFQRPSSRRRRKAILRRSGKALLLESLHRLGVSRNIRSITRDRQYPHGFDDEDKGSVDVEKAAKSSLAYITARYIAENMTAEKSSLSPFTKSASLPSVWQKAPYLESKGYTARDVHVWSYILTAQDGGKCIERISQMPNPERLPLFLLLHVFRHNTLIRPQHVASLCKILTRYLELQSALRWRAAEEGNQPEACADIMSQALLCFRLVRMACGHAATELGPIIELIKTFWDDNKQSPRFVCWLVNRILCELGRKPRVSNPFSIQSRFLQNAQYEILRYMIQSKPTILLTRLGFRGLIGSSLVKRKDETTRELVRNMRPSWPPWQQKQHGWGETYGELDDRGAGRSGSSTEAGKMLLEMERAGYAFSSWERGTLLLTGREVEGTPTIPTLRFADPFKKDNLVWLSRIQATRTLEEAWSIFLRFRLQRRSGNAQTGLLVYKEIFGKILRQRTQATTVAWSGGTGTEVASKAGQQPLPEPTFPSSALKGLRLPKLKLGVDWVPPEPELQEQSSFLYSEGTLIRGPSMGKGEKNPPDPIATVAGDSLELMEPPKNPSDRVYLSHPPPSTEMEMWDLMLRDGLWPVLDTVVMFLSYVPTFTDACAVLERWEATRSTHSKEDATKRRVTAAATDPTFHCPLLQWWNPDVFVQYASQETVPWRAPIPQRLLCAFIMSLTRLRQNSGPQRIPWSYYTLELPFAVEMLRVYNPAYTRAYYAAMHALSHLRPIQDPERRRSRPHQPQQEFRFLSPICDQKTAYSALWHVYNMMRERNILETMDVVGLLLYATEGQLRRGFVDVPQGTGSHERHPLGRAIAAFERAVGIGEGDEGLLASRPQAIPETALLHLYFRLLLVSRWKNHETLLKTLRWMVAHKELLQAKNRRLPLIAVRSFLEDDLGGSDALANAERIIGEGLDDWGGWPTEREVSTYKGVRDH